MECPIKSKRLSIAVQNVIINKKYRNIIITRNKKPIDIKIKLQPSIESKEYIIRIIYKKLTERPKILLNINQIDNEKARIPHIFKDIKIGSNVYKSLCLYQKYEWNNTHSITEIIPWISEWLYYYELWCITGEWLGGGHKFRKKDLGKGVQDNV